ncbi:sensor histidine kinase [Bacteroidota bacterium]
MNNPKRLTLIRLLMIISQLVLTAFVIQWLVAQFNSERSAFKKEVISLFAEGQEEVMDSMLVVHLIDPIMQGNRSYSLQMNISSDSLDCLDTLRMKPKENQRFLKIEGKTAMVAFGEMDSIESKEGKIVTTMPGKGQVDDVMLQSVKLIVQRAADTLYPDSGFAHIFTSMVDTAILKNRITEKIHRLDEELLTIWHDGLSYEEAAAQGIKIYLICAIPDAFCGVEVQNYFWYVAKETLPAAIFGLVLLMLTGGAFIVAFRSLKSQILLNQIRADFMSNITHELKTPVSTVKVALEALRNFNVQSDPKAASEYLEMASREMNRLDLLINQVLNASSTDNGVHLLEVEETDLGKLVAEVNEILKPRLEKAGATLSVEVDDRMIQVPLDRLHAQGVLINLIDNSLKYCGDNPKIAIGITRSEEEVTITIADNGPGIPDEYLGKIFDKFFRVPNGDRHNVKGYGLGLSYAAMVMQQHGGSIRASNNPDGGITFTLKFPAKSL